MSLSLIGFAAAACCELLLKRCFSLTTKLFAPEAFAWARRTFFAVYTFRSYGVLPLPMKLLKPKFISLSWIFLFEDAGSLKLLLICLLIYEGILVTVLSFFSRGPCSASSVILNSSLVVPMFEVVTIFRNSRIW